MKILWSRRGKVFFHSIFLKIYFPPSALFFILSNLKGKVNLTLVAHYPKKNKREEKNLPKGIILSYQA
jgi:hypothetical protein